MFELRCPVCAAPLARERASLRCGNGHCYDLAKQNYVNLLRSNQSSAKRHGDDKRMVAARTAFLDAGYYAPLRAALCAMALDYAPGNDAVHLLDAGCGEGYYTAALRRAFLAAQRPCEALGVDISKAALIAARRRDAALTLAVASIRALPVADGAADVLLSVFAPAEDAEFLRVLRPGGLLLRVLPLEEHLFGLKQAVYDRPYRNPPADYAPAGFALLERREVRGRMTVAPRAQIEALFEMTPYYYKTGAADQAKLRALDALETEYAFGLFALRREA